MKNELRKAAITRVYDAALFDAGVQARVVEVVEDRKRGLVARIKGEGEIAAVLGAFAIPWEQA